MVKDQWGREYARMTTSVMPHQKKPLLRMTETLFRNAVGRLGQRAAVGTILMDHTRSQQRNGSGLNLGHVVDGDPN